MLRSENDHPPSDQIIQDFDKLTFSEYASEAKKTAVFPPEQAKGYLPWGLLDETIETIEKFDRLAYGEGSPFTDEDIRSVQDEIGDILWYVAVYADLVGIEDHLRFYFYHCSEQVNEAPTPQGFVAGYHELKRALGLIHQCAGDFKKSIRDDGGAFAATAAIRWSSCRPTSAAARPTRCSRCITCSIRR